MGPGRKGWGCQLGEEKAPWRPHSNLPIFEVGLQGSQRQILYHEMKVSFIWKKFFTMRVLRHWNGLTREAVVALSLMIRCHSLT